MDRAGRRVSVVGLGAWQLGADWGEVGEDQALDVLSRGGRRRRHVHRHGGRLRRRAQRAADRPVPLRPRGRGRHRGDQDGPPGHAAGCRRIYTLDNFRAWTDRSRANLGVDTLDLVQLHCPPTVVYSTDEVFDALDTLVQEKRIAAYGVSVETRAEALAAIARPGVASVQLILNMLRLGPLAEVLPAAPPAGVGIIARVPLASGLLSGRYDAEHHLRRERPPQLQPARRGVRHRRDVLRASTSRRVSRPSGGWRRSCPPTRPWRSSRCAGSSTSPASPWSSPARAARSRPAATRPPPTWRRCRRRRSRAVREVYDELIAPQVRRPVVSEAVSPDGLRVRVAHHHNPYRYLLQDAEFDALLLELGLPRAASIGHHHTVAPELAPRGAYGRACMAFVMMDPTADPWVPNDQAVLAALVVGEEGSAFLPNAAAKAGGHRRLGRNFGEAVLVDPHRCGDGHFRYGHSAEVRGVIVGSSSQTTDQDLFEAAGLATDFIDAIAERHRTWERRVGNGEWLSDEDEPAAQHRSMVSWFPTD